MSYEKITALASQNIPFLFIVDFTGKNVQVFPLDELAQHNIEFSIQKAYPYKEHDYFLQKEAVPFSIYKKKFDAIIEKIKSGDTYIVNLTQPTAITTPLSLKEIYTLANAHYKLRFGDQFVCFSPETFIQIDTRNMIHTFPMKGTIDAAVDEAETKILANEKEMAEHIMVVDLLRNDLSMVASSVTVEKFRYVEAIAAGKKKLLQVSSHISGVLDEHWQDNLGDILQKLLPAGSISGTPKKSTLSIIESVEGYERGYFSGVFGVFDGATLDSGVMIRFIEKTSQGYIYKSGGGITLDSDLYAEYQEYQDKIYLP